MRPHPCTTVTAVSDDDVLLRARGLTKTFGDFTAVDGIDVEVRRGRRSVSSRAQRCRQVEHDADDRLRLAGQWW